ncbi:MAG: hypothetical protein ACRDLS_04190 [Solirubrobacteraceae bacterium]
MAVPRACASRGEINSVDEDDARPLYGNVVYFSSNTTSVFAGGMVRVGTPAARVDSFDSCDPNSDGTLIWRSWAIRTHNPRHGRLYGWIPARCPARLRP